MQTKPRPATRWFGGAFLCWLSPFDTRSKRGQVCVIVARMAHALALPACIYLELLSAVEQLLAKLKTSSGVDVQQMNRGTTGWRFADNDRLATFKMLLPVVRPGVK